MPGAIQDIGGKARNLEPAALGGSITFEGGAIAALRRLPSESMRCAVTSPPCWGLRDYGIRKQIGLEASISGFLSRLTEVLPR